MLYQMLYTTFRVLYNKFGSKCGGRPIKPNKVNVVHQKVKI